MNGLRLVSEPGTDNGEEKLILPLFVLSYQVYSVWANKNYFNPSIGFSVQLLELLKVKTDYF